MGCGIQVVYGHWLENRINIAFFLFVFFLQKKHHYSINWWSLKSCVSCMCFFFPPWQITAMGHLSALTVFLVVYSSCLVRPKLMLLLFRIIAWNDWLIKYFFYINQECIYTVRKGVKNTLYFLLFTEASETALLHLLNDLLITGSEATNTFLLLALYSLWYSISLNTHFPSLRD